MSPAIIQFGGALGSAPLRSTTCVVATASAFEPTRRYPPQRMTIPGSHMTAEPRIPGGYGGGFGHEGFPSGSAPQAQFDEIRIRESPALASTMFPSGRRNI